MIYTPLTKKALKLCFEVHKNQTDKSGMPYVFHPFHLAEQMKDEYTVCTALLHDVVEDSHVTPEDLRNYGFPDEVVNADQPYLVLMLLFGKKTNSEGIESINSSTFASVNPSL